jgi:hypothetical protein
MLGTWKRDDCRDGISSLEYLGIFLEYLEAIFGYYLLPFASTVNRRACPPAVDRVSSKKK